MLSFAFGCIAGLIVGTYFRAGVLAGARRLGAGLAALFRRG